MASHPRLVSAYAESRVVCIYDDDSKPKMNRRSYAREVLDVFLPAGYPHTVTPDYTPYQIYVSLLPSFNGLKIEVVQFLSPLNSI